jgi:hypothetical protein
MKKLLILISVFFITTNLLANKAETSEAVINYAGFMALTDEVEKHRRQRLVNLDTFKDMASDKNTIILDSRSEQMYKRRHIAGAVHLNFSDFTEEKLAQIIPSKQTRILIYCNNNFSNDPENFALKKVDLALNIPTFINLYGYGYKNIYELSDLVSVSDSNLDFSGTAQEQ